MKNLLFGLLAVVLIVLHGVAQDKKDISQRTDFKSASLITTFENEVIEYKFLSLVELNEEIEHIIQELDFSNLQNTKQKTCEVIIQIKVEVTIGDATGVVSGSIITSCAGAANATKRLKAMLLAAAMG